MKKGSHHNSQTKQKMSDSQQLRRVLERDSPIYSVDEAVSTQKRSFWRRIFRV